MILRRRDSSILLITQVDHAALGARIMERWQGDGLPSSPRRASILRAVAAHDDGWDEVDAELVVDLASGKLVDFVAVSDDLKRATSLRGIAPLASDPYAAALVAQHRLHVYRRYAEQPEWAAFFAEVTRLRDRFLGASGEALPILLAEYRLLRAGDLSSLAFCNEWPEICAEECGYAMRLEGTTLHVAPDPFGGRTIDVTIAARELAEQTFASAAEARRALAATPSVRLEGRLRGG